MVAYFKQFFASPVFEQDEDKTNRARVLNSLLVNIAIVLILHMAITPLFVVNKLGSSILVAIVPKVNKIKYDSVRNDFISRFHLLRRFVGAGFPPKTER